MFLLAVSATGLIGLIALLTTAWLSQRADEAPPPPVAHLITHAYFDAQATYAGKTYCRERGMSFSRGDWFDKQAGTRASSAVAWKLDVAVKESIHLDESAKRLERMRDL